MNILWAFITFYGLTFSIGSDTTDSDINRYISWFHNMRSSGMDFKDLTALLYVDKDYADVLQPVLTFMVSRLTDNAAYLTAAFGFVFGYFYSRNLGFVIKRLDIQSSTYIYILLLCFALVAPIWLINGFRFWTATHIFFYSAFLYIVEKRKLYIILLCSTIFVHFSFIVPVFSFLLYIVLGDRPKLFFYAMLISLFVTQLNIEFLTNIINTYLPSTFAERSSGYVDEDKIEKIANTVDTRNLYAVLYLSVLKWIVIAYLVYIYSKGVKLFKNDKALYSLFSFVLYFYAVSNVLTAIPSGGRFTRLANLFALAFVIIYLSNVLNDRGFKKLFNFSIPLLLVFLITTIRIGLSSIGVVTIAGNPLTALFVPSDVALIDLIK